MGGSQREESYEKYAQLVIDTETEILEKEIEILEKRQEAYEKYYDEVDKLREEEQRTQSAEDVQKQLAALAGGSGSATNAQRKELLTQLESLREEEEQARRRRACQGKG